jgi:hypothetical protein
VAQGPEGSEERLIAKGDLLFLLLPLYAEFRQCLTWRSAANRGSDRLDVLRDAAGTSARFYVCTKTARLEGITLGEIALVPGPRANAMIDRARDEAINENAGA